MSGLDLGCAQIGPPQQSDVPRVRVIAEKENSSRAQIFLAPWATIRAVPSLSLRLRRALLQLPVRRLHTPRVACALQISSRMTNVESPCCSLA